MKIIVGRTETKRYEIDIPDLHPDPVGFAMHAATHMEGVPATSDTSYRVHSIVDTIHQVPKDADYRRHKPKQFGIMATKDNAEWVVKTYDTKAALDAGFREFLMNVWCTQLHNYPRLRKVEFV